MNFILSQKYCNFFISRCLTRLGGRMLIGVPTGSDGVLYNMHRIYGPLQLSHLLANWELGSAFASMRLK